MNSKVHITLQVLKIQNHCSDSPPKTTQYCNVCSLDNTTEQIKHYLINWEAIWLKLVLSYQEENLSHNFEF